MAHARPRASPPWASAATSPWPRLGAEQQHGHGRLLVGAQRPGHRGPQPAEGCHVRPAEHRAKVDTMAVRLCYPAFRGAWVQNDQVRDRSAYSYLYFVPIGEAAQRGARWLRCDLTLRARRLAGEAADRPQARAQEQAGALERGALPGRQGARHHDVLVTPHYRAAAAVTIDDQEVPQPQADDQDRPQPVPAAHHDRRRLPLHLDAARRSGPSRATTPWSATTATAEVSRARRRRRGRHTRGPTCAWRSRRPPRR